MNRIAPSETIRQDLAQLLAGGLRTTDINPLGDMMRWAARLVLQEALEAEPSDFLGRGRYQREPQEEKRGYRNGYELASLRTAEGRLDVSLPHVRGARQMCWARSPTKNAL